MNILITGGAGFIGSSLIAPLLQRGDKVVALDNFDEYYHPAIKRLNISAYQSSDRFSLAEADIRDLNAIRDLLSSTQFDCIVHCAARAGVRPSMQNPLLYEDVNIKGTLNLLECARESGLPKIVFCSSSSVYGNHPTAPFGESDPVDNPISPYAATKKAGELLCYTYHSLYRLSTICLRLFTVYGPRQRPEMAIHKFTRSIDRGVPLTMFGDGSTSRDYTYIDDLLDGIIRAVDADLGYEIINLGESYTIRLNDLLVLIERALGKKALLRQLPAQPGDVEHTFADISKAQRLLGYDPHTSMESGIESFVRWYRQEGPRWLPYISEA